MILKDRTVKMLAHLAIGNVDGAQYMICHALNVVVGPILIGRNLLIACDT
jgi:hypothetical protein